MSQNAAFAIEQDQDGFMWFGTRNGLNKFDGYRFTQFQNEEGNPNSLIFNHIREVYYDEKVNFIWVGTFYGLNIFISPEKGFQRINRDDFDQEGLSRDKKEA